MFCRSWQRAARNLSLGRQPSPQSHEDPISFLIFIFLDSTLFPFNLIVALKIWIRQGLRLKVVTPRDGPSFAPACHTRLKLDLEYQPNSFSNKRNFNLASFWTWLHQYFLTLSYYWVFLRVTMNANLQIQCFLCMAMYDWCFSILFPLIYNVMTRQMWSDD